jgi:hypothetical protein
MAILSDNVFLEVLMLEIEVLNFHFIHQSKCTFGWYFYVSFVLWWQKLICYKIDFSEFDVQ